MPRTPLQPEPLGQKLRRGLAELALDLVRLRLLLLADKGDAAGHVPVRDWYLLPSISKYLS